MGEGGFLPFGLTGVIAGAAKCFYGYVGFNCVTTTGEEAKRPQRDIPLAIIFSLFIIFLSYLGISVVLTMMLPYYSQDPNAPIAYAFKTANLPVIMYIVTIGAVFALGASLLGSMVPLPRIIYAMSDDGLLFKSLSKVNSRTKTPLYTTIFSGFLTGIIAMFVDLQELVELMSIGTLMEYTLVNISVLILRYRPIEGGVEKNLKKCDVRENSPNCFSLLFNWNGVKMADCTTSNTAEWAIITFCKIIS